jgi:hypothetical protein
MASGQHPAAWRWAQTRTRSAKYRRCRDVTRPWWFQWLFSVGYAAIGHDRKKGRTRRNKAVLRRKSGWTDGFRQDLARHFAWFEKCGLVHRAEMTGELHSESRQSHTNGACCSALDLSQTIVPAARATQTSNGALRCTALHCTAPLGVLRA